MRARRSATTMGRRRRTSRSRTARKPICRRVKEKRRSFFVDVAGMRLIITFRRHLLRNGERAAECVVGRHRYGYSKPALPLASSPRPAIFSFPFFPVVDGDVYVFSLFPSNQGDFGSAAFFSLGCHHHHVGGVVESFFYLDCRGRMSGRPATRKRRKRRMRESRSSYSCFC